MSKLKFLPFLLATIIFASCKQKGNTLFRLVEPSESGVDFRNDITESKDHNIIKLEYLYNGGGVAVADFNNDGLKDLFFSGNMVPNKLYLNKGGFKFEDISQKAGIGGENRWKSGVAVVDINGDGWQDIYVCATIAPDSASRMNMLFVNKGLDKNGIPTFKDEAAAYGIADPGYSSNAAFFDYDNDGDLDLYVLTNSKPYGVPIVYRPKVNDGTSPTNDKLFRNNGDGTFTNVAKEVGIVCEGYGLGIGIFDVNKDGWLDIYVSNDYLTNDLLYVNHQGKFVNEIDSLIKHQSKFSMGNDIADINNDGFLDIITLDMLPEKNLRKKSVIGDAGYVNYINDQRFGYAHQYTRNMLQLNNGDGTFSEIGRIAGVYQTEWSWSPLFADFDNDGHRDLMVTNGFPKDITDRDFVSFRTEVGALATHEYLLDEVPSVKVANYAYKNNGDLSFTDMTKAWGIERPSFSNGAAFADLDNDGDLDYVVNNINDPAFIYENTLYSTDKKDAAPSSHYLRVKLEGPKQNPAGIGTKLTLWASSQMQYHEHSVYRGYISSVEDIVHFGLGKNATVDSMKVVWPDGKTELLRSTKADQVLTIKHQNAKTSTIAPVVAAGNKLLQEVTKARKINYRQPEYDIIDYNLQRTLPHKFTQNSPGLAVGDVNGDGLEDFCLGSFAYDTLTLFVQQPNGGFKPKKLQSGNQKPYSDTGLLLFDADGDKDQDLYVVSGGFQFPKDSEYYQDRLFRNDGKGNFTWDSLALPSTMASGSCVRATDFDADGDLDLFVGGRVVPKAWPLPSPSYLLKNESGKFVNANAQWCPVLDTLGMVTDALWTDYDRDGKQDLVVVGEFMPVQVFHHEAGKLVLAKNTGLENQQGWWNSIVGGDFDGDGDIDYVAGNLGTNNQYNPSAEHPLKVFAGDFDKNNDLDAIVACYYRMEDDSKQLCPVHFWDDLNKQSPKFRRRFSRYKQYGLATVDSLLTPEEQKTATILECNYVYTSYIENLSGGKFKMSALPIQAQVSPVNGLIPFDINGDGNLDLLLTGNDFGNEVFSGTYDALSGLVLLGNGKGGFQPVPIPQSGLMVPGDAKAFGRLSDKNGSLFLATQNRGDLRAFSPTLPKSGRLFSPQPTDVSATWSLTNGKKQRQEFHYGSGGYLSQSSRGIWLPADVTEVEIMDSKGKTRKEVLKEVQ
ncbi:MAG: VCBS repeat-containing protein [Saprospiraceae bacterium]|nr:VCBS repeat-containing protein [Saprospiraceae bacterium]